MNVFCLYYYLCLKILREVYLNKRLDNTNIYYYILWKESAKFDIIYIETFKERKGMYDTVAYIYKDYRIEFKEEGYHVYGEAFYPGEVLPVGTITGHSYNSKDENDISHMKDNSLHIDMLIVSEKHNGKGVGSTLMKMMMLYVEKRNLNMLLRIQLR